MLSVTLKMSAVKEDERRYKYHKMQDYCLNTTSLWAVVECTQVQSLKLKYKFEVLIFNMGIFSSHATFYFYSHYISAYNTFTFYTNYLTAITSYFSIKVLTSNKTKEYVLYKFHDNVYKHSRQLLDYTTGTYCLY